MPITKKDFLKKVTILIDTREQKNKHITDELDKLGIMYEDHKNDYGDYTFSCEGRDFSLSCVIERKADVDELYGNVMKDRDRLEKEFYAASKLSTQFTLLIESVGSWQELKDYQVPDWQIKQFNRKVIRIGEHCYNTLQAWRVGNRYGFSVEFVKDKKDTAVKILEIFYYYWRTYKELTEARK